MAPSNPIKPAPVTVAPLFAPAVPTVAAFAEMVSAGNVAKTPSVNASPGFVRFNVPSTNAVTSSCQQFASAGQPLLYRVLGQFQLLRDGLQWIVARGKKYERFTINLRDLFERTPENRLFFVGDGVIGWQRIRAAD